MMLEEIYNMHTHIFPEKISVKAVDAIGKFYELAMSVGGTSEEIIADGQRIGVTKYLVCSTATTHHQVAAINNFVSGEVNKYKEFIGFGSLHNDMTPAEIYAETDRIISLGLCGVKLHPDFQHFNIDDESAFPIYEACEGRLPILFHTGDNRYEYSKPVRLYRVLERFPKLVAIAAHLGGYQSWDEINVYLGHDNLYIDTSSSLAFMSTEKARSIIEKHGIDKVFFGTDSPMWRHDDELERFNKLGFNESDRRKILSSNAKTFIAKTKEKINCK